MKISAHYETIVMNQRIKTPVEIRIKMFGN